PGHDTISFALPGAGPHTFTPASPLPDITDSIVIDGFTQAGPGAHVIVLDGTSVVGLTAGLRLQAGGSGSTISGLVIHRFQNAIQLVNSNDNRISDCYLGLAATGTTAVGLQRAGVLVQGSKRNSIGAPGHGNVVTSNFGIGGIRSAIGI